MFSPLRRFSLVLAATFALPSLVVHAEEAADETISLNIITWNIEWYPGMRRFARGEEMAAHTAIVDPQLAEMNPDIFLAQEMRDWNSFARLCDGVEGLRPASVSAFTSPSTGEYWNQQLGIGSKLQVAAAWSEPWNEGSEIIPRRGFNSAVLRIPGGDFRENLLIYNVHLKSNLSSNEEEAVQNYRIREESVRQLLAHMKEMKERVFKDRIKGVIVAGDFNTNDDGQFGDDRTIAMMEEAGFHNTWEGVPREERLSWRGSDRFEPTTFDFIFTMGLPKATARLIPVQEGSSDHWPVQIILDL